MAITSLHELREHLQWAIQLEHATIPPYLFALYSIKPGTNTEASHIITSVVIEEMLHMTLAANVLNAVGGTPHLDRPDFIPHYPTYLPHSNGAFRVHLEPFSPSALETFMKIEHPGEPDAPPEDDEYESIGQFYLAIEQGLKFLCEELGEDVVFTGNRKHQITPQCFEYHASGHVVPVTDLASALEALDEIVEQGEGLAHKEVWDGDRDMFHPEREEVAHYFRYMEIREGRSFKRGDSPQSGPTGEPFDVNWDAVYPLTRNPVSRKFKGGSEAVQAIGAFNLAYSDLLRELQVAFTGDRDRLERSLANMYEIANLARDIVRMPSGRDDGLHAAPTFEWIPASQHQQAAHTDYAISIEKDGPYVVKGGVPLTRKSILYSEHHEPLAWQHDDTLKSANTMRLCRCGHSNKKPYCDGSHAHEGFSATEDAPLSPSASRARRFEGTDITMTDDSPLCVHAGFCGDRDEDVWAMIPKTDDSKVRFTVIHRVHNCPAGKLSIERNGALLEPDLPEEIAAVKDGPLWVTGGIPVTLPDGTTLEVRNRVTLCRCGQSKIKPYCDGSHGEAGFSDPK